MGGGEIKEANKTRYEAVFRDCIDNRAKIKMLKDVPDFHLSTT